MVVENASSADNIRFSNSYMAENMFCCNNFVGFWRSLTSLILSWLVEIVSNTWLISSSKARLYVPDRFRMTMMSGMQSSISCRNRMECTLLSIHREIQSSLQPTKTHSPGVVLCEGQWRGLGPTSVLTVVVIRLIAPTCASFANINKKTSHPGTLLHTWHPRV